MMVIVAAVVVIVVVIGVNPGKKWGSRPPDFVVGVVGLMKFYQESEMGTLSKSGVFSEGDIFVYN